MGDHRNRRRRWAVAALVSLAAHGLVFLGLSLTPRDGPPEPSLPVMVTLERATRSPPKKAIPTELRAPANPFQVHQPPQQAVSLPNSGLAPSAPSTTGAPATPGPATPQQAVAPPKLKLDCLNMGPAARTGVYGREDCEARTYRKLAQGERGYDVPENPAWDAAIAARQSVHRPLPAEKPFRNDCANSNLGLGCTDGMLVPLVKRKF
jgi:hypothetical protein